mmetsp:Transcript_9651/g.16966  ORF Transcript_9651/g.16966 Transcript_9651/m.16966 type:complete len:182 (+) Transcript_9651:234-779(+)
MGSVRASKELTNAFVVDGGRILLGMKKRGFGAGKWNGFGGKLDAGETPLQAAQREFKEEAGVTMLDPKLVGKVVYTYDGMEKDLKVFVFRATSLEPEQPQESEEMAPAWFDTDKIPFDSMWADDRYWHKHLLDNTRFEARFEFARDMSTIKGFVVNDIAPEKELAWIDTPLELAGNSAPYS